MEANVTRSASSVQRKSIVLVVAAIAVVVLTCPICAFADTVAASVKLGPWARGLKVGPGMDASGRVLRGCCFEGINLRDSVFDGAVFAGCRMYQCDLSDASFKNAIFTGLSWGDCKIRGADFTDATVAGVTPIPNNSGYAVSFTAEQLTSTRNFKTKNLADCILSIRHPKSAPPAFDFRAADLKNARLETSDLTRCDFTDAVVTGMGVNGGKILFRQLCSTENFKEGNLRGVGFGGITTVDNWNLRGLDLTRATFNGSGLLRDVDMTDAIIAGCFLRCSVTARQLQSTKSYRDGNLQNVRFWNLDLGGVDFSGMELSGCEFHSCNLHNASFEDAVITGSRFSSDVVEDRTLPVTARQIKSTWNFKHRRMVGIQLPKDVAAALRLENGDRHQGEQGSRHPNSQVDRESFGRKVPRVVPVSRRESGGRPA